MSEHVKIVAALLGEHDAFQEIADKIEKKELRSISDVHGYCTTMVKVKHDQVVSYNAAPESPAPVVGSEIQGLTDDAQNPEAPIGTA